MAPSTAPPGPSGELRLMGIFAHPDDESLGAGGVLARYAAEGVRAILITATRGERGRFGRTGERPAPEVVGRVREQELRAAAEELGIAEVHLLGYMDRELDGAEPREAIGRIVGHVRRSRPHVVLTFAADGAYGHPDHIAISQLTTAAIVCAADASYQLPRAPTPVDGSPVGGAGGPEGAAAAPHRVSKLYHLAWPRQTWELYQAAFKRLTTTVEGVERQANPWPEWAITTRVDARAHWRTVWRAINRHRTQMAVYERLGELTPEQHEALWGDQQFYRVFSLVNGGRETESDLFEGLR